MVSFQQIQNKNQENPFQLNPEERSHVICIEEEDSQMTQEDDFVFKPKELAIIEEEPDSIDRAIHFRIVNTGSNKGEIEMDTYFYIEEHLPTHTLSNINKFCPSPMPDAITFYLDSKRLTNSVPLRILPRSIEHPVLIYTSCMPVSGYTSRQLKQHFNLLYLPLK
jgi:hypothetical protein